MGEGQLCFRRRGRRQPWKTFTKVNYVPNSKNWPTATTLKHFQNSFTNIKQFRTSAGSFSQTKIDFVKLQLQQFSRGARIFFSKTKHHPHHLPRIKLWGSTNLKLLLILRVVVSYYNNFLKLSITMGKKLTENGAETNGKNVCNLWGQKLTYTVFNLT